MTEKMTTIRLPSAFGSGLMEYGEQDAATMIAALRQHAAETRALADEVLAASDSDFRIEVVRGVHVQHHVRLIQDGRAHTADCRCVGCSSERRAAA